MLAIAGDGYRLGPRVKVRVRVRVRVRVMVRVRKRVGVKGHLIIKERFLAEIFDWSRAEVSA